MYKSFFCDNDVSCALNSMVVKGLCIIILSVSQLSYTLKRLRYHKFVYAISSY